MKDTNRKSLVSLNIQNVVVLEMVFCYDIHRRLTRINIPNVVATRNGCAFHDLIIHFLGIKTLEQRQ